MSEQLTLLPPANPRERLDDPAWLTSVYQRHTVHEIGHMCGCSPTTVLNRLNRYGIRLRKAGQTPRVVVDFDDPGFMARVRERMSLDLARGEVGPSVLGARVRAAALADREGDVEARTAALAEVAAASMIWAGVA